MQTNHRSDEGETDMEGGDSMTLKEATEAAERRQPVIHNGIEYLRITEAGYRYDHAGIKHPFIQLLDKCGHSVTYAEPSRATLKEPEKCVICGSEITGYPQNGGEREGAAERPMAQA